MPNMVKRTLRSAGSYCQAPRIEASPCSFSVSLRTEHSLAVLSFAILAPSYGVTPSCLCSFHGATPSCLCSSHGVTPSCLCSFLRSLPQVRAHGGAGMSFTAIALAAFDGGRGRVRLATVLLDHERRAAEKVKLLLSMDQAEGALWKAVESLDHDLVFLALLHLEHAAAEDANPMAGKKKLQELFALVARKPEVQPHGSSRPSWPLNSLPPLLRTPPPLACPVVPFLLAGGGSP